MANKDPAVCLPTIIIIEDHPLLRDGLVSFLEGTGRWKVIGAASNIEEAKNILLNAAADILLLDIQLEDGLGFSIVPWLKSQKKNKKSMPVIAVYSAFDDFVHVSAALSIGAKVYMCKRRSVNELEQALLKALDGKTCIDDTVQSKLDIVTDLFCLLTKREAQILTMVNSGLSDKQIAQQLGISPRTVQNIVYCIFDKTGIRSRVELQKL
ncbi:MAG: response regulator transcription factor [Treponema sp.]|nr:response regulator transcription factor [Treponema sp.]